MKFVMKEGKGFSDCQMIHEDPVVARKLNGFIVEHDSDEYFISTDDIDIIEISDKEQKTEMRW